MDVEKVINFLSRKRSSYTRECTSTLYRKCRFWFWLVCCNLLINLVQFAEVEDEFFTGALRTCKDIEYVLRNEGVVEWIFESEVQISVILLLSTVDIRDNLSLNVLGWSACSKLLARAAGFNSRNGKPLACTSYTCNRESEQYFSAGAKGCLIIRVTLMTGPSSSKERLPRSVWDRFMVKRCGCCCQSPVPLGTSKHLYA